MAKKNEWKNFKNILCVRLDNMGDVIMTTPAFRAIKESIKNSSLTLLTSTLGESITPFIPYIDHVIKFDAPWVKTDKKTDFKLMENVTYQIKKQKFDGAIIFTVYSQSPFPAALLCSQAGIKNILSYAHEKPYNLISNWVKDNEPNQFIKHEVERQLDLVSTISCKTSNTSFSLKIPKEAYKEAKEKLLSKGVDLTKEWIVVHPGATSISRRYPKEGFSKIATQLIQKGYQVILTGTESEKEIIEDIQKKVGKNSFSFINTLSLPSFMALIDMSPLIISNNSGPVHIASAFKTPVIVLYALTNPQHTPWQVKNKVLYFDIPTSDPKQTLKMLNPKKIVKAVDEILEINEYERN